MALLSKYGGPAFPSTWTQQKFHFRDFLFPLVTCNCSTSKLTFVLPEVDSFDLVGDDLLEIDNVLVAELLQDLDLSYGRDGEPLSFRVRCPNHLQRHYLSAGRVCRFEDFSVSSFANLGVDLEGVDAPLPPGTWVELLLR